MDARGKVKLYAVSTCTHCKALMEFLKEHQVEFSFVNVDELEGSARREMVKKVKELNKRCTFPTLVVGERVIVGFKEEEVRETLRI
ncbi:MAG: glutaredoxin family protein [Desulfofustis sp.]|jgi:glutaredoxin-like protein NrdH